MKRRSFTLVELLVAIAIIVALVGIVLAFRSTRESKIATEGASQLETYLAAAKARALRDQRPVGVQLLTDDNGRTFHSAQLVVAPEPLAPIDPGDQLAPPAIYLDLPAQASITAPSQNVARQVGFPLRGQVEVGDVLEIAEMYSSHRIVSIDYSTNIMTLAASLIIDPITMQRYVEGVPRVSGSGRAIMRNQYRYVRAPRPLVGEAPWQLQKGVVIHGATGIIPSSLNIPVDSKGQWEIRFSPAGTPINADGRIVLWVEDINSAGPARLVCIYPSGAIAGHPKGPLGNEYEFTRDGR